MTTQTTHLQNEYEIELADYAFTTVLNYTFQVTDNTDVKVEIEFQNSNLANFELVPGTYLVTPNADNVGGFITLGQSIPSSLNSYTNGIPYTTTLRIYRDTERVQNTDLVNHGSLDVEVLERLFDKFILIHQEIDTRLNGTVSGASEIRDLLDSLFGNTNWRSVLKGNFSIQPSSGNSKTLLIRDTANGDTSAGVIPYAGFPKGAVTGASSYYPALTGVVDGTNRTFTIPGSGKLLTEFGSLLVYYNGAAQTAFTVSGRNITFNFTPTSNSQIAVFYHET